MAKFLVTSGVSHYLEQIIKNCTSKLILISPYIKINSRIKEYLTDLDRLKINIHIVFGKTELQSQELKWIEQQL